MSLTTKSLLALALAGSLSACGGGGGAGKVEDLTLSDLEKFSNTGNIYITDGTATLKCNNFDCSLSAYGETMYIDIDVNEVLGTATISGSYNGSTVIGQVDQYGNYSWELLGGEDQLLYNEVYLTRLSEGETKYISATEAAIITTQFQGYTGEDVVIDVIDWFAPGDSAHGDHVSDVIEYIAPGADIYENDVTLHGEHELQLISDYGQDWWATSDIINFSGGVEGLTQSELDNDVAFVNQFLAPVSDALIVVSAGNAGLSCSTVETCNISALTFDEAETISITVGALSDDGKTLDNYSNLAGLTMDSYIAAPVVETADGGRGTSFAAPVVTGVAALIIDKFNTDAEATRDIIFSTADDLGAPGVDPIYGNGALNVSKALAPVGHIK